MIFPVNIEWTGDLKIDQTVDIGPFTTINCKEQIIIQHNTLISPGVCIVDFDHNTSGEDLGNIWKDSTEPVLIGHHSWIGANSVILKGVVLGPFCVVGAGSVVTHSFPEKSIIVGNPARLLRKR